jgi:predicted hexulose-6-phosphate isomerase
MQEIRLGLYEKATPPELNWNDRLEAAKRAGYDFLEISIDETDIRLSRLDWTNSEIHDLAASVRETGLPIRTMCLSGHRKYPLGSRDPETRAQGIQIFEKAVRFADALGIRIIQLAGYDVYYEEGAEDTRGWFAENLEKGVLYAAKYGVMTGFETMETPFMDTVGKAMAYVHKLNSPYLGVYPDLGNLTNAAKLHGHDLYEDIESGRGHLLAMHLKDTRPGIYRDLDFGDGHVDFPRGAKAALNQGVRLFVTELWHDGRADWPDRLAGVSAFARSVLS